MSQQTMTDEIDLFQLFETLWRGKWQIIIITALSLCVGFAFVTLSEREFQSNIRLSVLATAPGQTEKGVLLRYRNAISNEATYAPYLATSGAQHLTKADFETTEEIQGFRYQRDDKDILFSMTNQTIFIRSGDQNKIADLSRYFAHVATAETAKQVKKAKEELELGTLMTRDKNDLSRLEDKKMNLREFIAEFEDGDSQLTLSAPTFPDQIAPRTFLVLVMSIFIGGFVSVMLVLVRAAIQNRRSIITS